MKTSFAPFQALLLTAPIAAPASHIPAQTRAAPDPLFQTVQSLDARLFDAYNRCDLQKFGSLVADDLARTIRGHDGINPVPSYGMVPQFFVTHRIRRCEREARLEMLGSATR